MLSFLVPADTPSLTSANMAVQMTIPLRNGFNGVLDEIARRNAQQILAIFDASRSYPFARDATHTLEPPAGRVAPEPPMGSFIIYSAAMNQSPYDSLGPQDDSPYSVFARYFLPNIRESGDLVHAVRATRAQIEQAIAHRNNTPNPTYYDALRDGACLFGDCPATPDFQQSR